MIDNNGINYDLELSTSRNLTEDSNVNIQPVILKIYGSDIRIKSPYKMGKLYTFLFYKGEPIIVIGPTYYMSILLFIVINILEALLIYFIYPSLHSSIKYIGSFIYIVQIFTQAYSTVINPGIPHRKNHLSQDIMETIYQNVCSGGVSFEKYRVCKRCNILVNTDENVIHCEECDICFKGLYN